MIYPAENNPKFGGKLIGMNNQRLTIARQASFCCAQHRRSSYPKPGDAAVQLVSGELNSPRGSQQEGANG